MTDIDLTTLPRQKALDVCKEVFGMDTDEANDFIDLAQGTVTEKTTAQKRVPKGRHGGGQFAKKVGGYAGAVGLGLAQAASGAAYGHALRGVLFGKKPGRALALALGATAVGNTAATTGAKLRSKFGKKTAKKLELVQKLTRATATTAYLAYRLRKPAGALLRHVRNRRRASHNPFDAKKVVNVTDYKFAQSMLTRVSTKAAKRSYDEIIASVRDAFRTQFPYPKDGTMGTYCWIAETWPGYVIVEENGKYSKVTYDDNLVFAERGDWTAVEKKVEWTAKQLPAQAFIFKEADGDYRWVLLSSNGFRDRDGQIVSTKGLERDAALWDLEGSPANPLRWWHVALTDDHSTGLELGYTDFRMVQEHTLIESGKFLSKEIGEGVYNARDQLEASIGFRHSPNEPDEEGVFENVHIFETSLLPKGKASNVLTQLLVTE